MHQSRHINAPSTRGLAWIWRRNGIPCGSSVAAPAEPDAAAAAVDPGQAQGKSNSTEQQYNRNFNYKKGNDGNNNEEDGDDDDSSSEETVEDSVEPGRRKRDVSSSIGGGRAGIPGLPDPATIIKIAQLFQSVGEQIVPILLEAVLPAGEATGDRITRKRSLESASLELQRIFK